MNECVPPSQFRPSVTREWLFFALILLLSVGVVGFSATPSVALQTTAGSEREVKPTPGAQATYATTPVATVVAVETPPTPSSTPHEVTPADEPVQMAMAPAALLPTPDGVWREARVPILMYHYISDPPRGSDAIRRDLSLSATDFEVELRYLANEGYHAVRLADLVMHLRCGTPLPEKPIVLTFDDGYRDAYTVAFPLLKKYGFIGTFFIFTKPINEGNRDYLSWREVELMSAAGMEFGSHSYSHPDLRGKPREFLQREISASKEEIEQHIHQPVRVFCYPSGEYDRQVKAAVAEAGYWAAVTTQFGTVHTSDNVLELARVRVRGGESLERFDYLLNLEPKS